MECKVTATRAQLTSVGVDRDIRGLKVKVVGDFKDGYVKVEMKPRRAIVKILGDKFHMEEYDIPKRWLKEI